MLHNDRFKEQTYVLLDSVKEDKALVSPNAMHWSRTNEQ